MKSHWACPSPDFDYGNVGDVLTPIIIKYLTGERPVYAEPNECHKLLACGSLCEFIQDGDTVWGSGLISRDVLIAQKKKRNVNILAVRGKKTAELLRQVGYEVPEVYGDPAVLMPEIYQPKYRVRQVEVAVVPHYVEIEAFKLAFPDKMELSITDDPFRFIDKLVCCGKIITSSLHAYILAQAYGIQAEYLQLTSKIIGGYFKYEDYISGRGDTEKFKQVFKEWCKNQ